MIDRNIWCRHQATFGYTGCSATLCLTQCSQMATYPTILKETLVGAASAQGKGPAVACMETQSRTQCLISVQHEKLLQKERFFWAEIGAKRPNFGQIRTVRWHRPCTVGTILFEQTVLALCCAVQIRYGPSRRSKKPKDGVVGL